MTAASFGDLVIALRADSTGFAADLKKSNRTLGGFVKESVSNLANIGLAVNTVKMAFGALIGPMQEAQEAALAERKLAQVFKSTASAAGVAKDDIMAYAAERQKLTSFDADDTVNAAAILGSFTNVKGGLFTQALTSAQDLSAFMGTDLQSSILMVGKALNDPVKGLTALSRAGIQFTAQQKEQIKRLQESGNLAKAQAIILKEMQTQFGGQAVALVDPIMQAKNAWGDFMETIGGIANEKLLPMMPKLIESFKVLSDMAIGAIEAVEKLNKAIKGPGDLSRWEMLNLGIQSVLSGESPEDMMGALRDMRVGNRSGGGNSGTGQSPEAPVAQAITRGFGTLQELINQRQNQGLPTDELRALRDKEKGQWLDAKGLKNPAEQMLAGFIRDGIAAVGSGLMSLGPAAKGTPENRVGSLEQGSAEAFEVMRANVGPGGKDKTAEKQLSEAQKQTKILGKLEKKMTGPEMAALQLKIMGIED